MQRLGSAVVEAAYRAQQLSLLVPAMAAQRSVQRVTQRGFRPERAPVRAVRRRYRQLLATDLANAEAGLYPRALLFQFPFHDYLRQMPRLALDIPRTWRRQRRADFRDLPAEAEPSRYPPYYQRNFHWQTDGYLSRRSAELYDLGVEWLFLGTADVMRRQIIPPISRFLAERGDARARLCDVGCGTGRTLAQIAAAHPRLRLFGVDISPYYLAAARELLSSHADASFLVENAEALPLQDATFDVVSSVFVFHELPRDARRRVLAEMHRTLAPGGLAVVADSAQASESPELAPLLAQFSTLFHEPYYKGYQADPLEDALTEVGFRVQSVESHFVTKVVTARKA